MHPRRFRPRITVRRLMIAVAIAGLLLGAGRWIVEMRARSIDYESRAYQFAQFDGHRLQCIEVLTTKDGRFATSDEDESFWLMMEWNHTLGNKYWRLSNRPWLPVEPDPPYPDVQNPHLRSAADCPAELRLRGRPCDWLRDPVHPWWTFLWTWHKPNYIYGISYYSP